MWLKCYSISIFAIKSKKVSRIFGWVNLHYSLFYIYIHHKPLQDTAAQPIHLAAFNGRKEMIDLLVDKYHVDPESKVMVI